jgi:hypothetical protein
MTYFQEEMTSHMRYQIAKGYDTPFFISARYRVIDLEKANMVSGYERDTEYASNVVGNALIEWQAKINDTLYIPIFAVTANGRIYGTPDAGTLVIDNLAMDDNGFIDESITRYLFGGGLFINGKTIKGGFYAGYCLEQYNVDNKGSILNSLGRWQSSHSYKDDSWNHSLKIALLPALDTSNWKYVGNILNSVLGYIGLGDAVEVYAGEEEDRTISTIVNTLNYALDLGFRKLEFDPLSFDTRFFYRRNNYDASARADTYGTMLSFSFPKLSFGVEGEFGFKHFYSVSKYFHSRYSDTWFFSIGLSFFNFKSYLMKTWFDNILLIYSYDAISKHSFAVNVICSNIAALTFDLSFGEETYNTGNYLVKEKSFAVGLGLRCLLEKKTYW